MERPVLYDRVDRRVDAMMDAGLEDEVCRLVDAGYGWNLPAMSGLGYVQFRPYFEEQASLEEVVTEIKRATRRFIRRQYNWFRLNDPRIRWFDVSQTETEEAAIETLVMDWLKKNRKKSGCLDASLW